MILHSVTGVIPYEKIKVIGLNNVQEAIFEKIQKAHSYCEQLKNDAIMEDIVITFENDGVYYQLDIEA